jgi:hypothetical protein
MSRDWIFKYVRTAYWDCTSVPYVAYIMMLFTLKHCTSCAVSGHFRRKRTKRPLRSTRRACPNIILQQQTNKMMRICANPYLCQVGFVPILTEKNSTNPVPYWVISLIDDSTRFCIHPRKSILICHIFHLFIVHVEKFDSFTNDHL